MRSFNGGYTMVSSINHEKFGLATYVKNDLVPSVPVLTSENDLYTAVTINDETVVNVYKPPSAQFENFVLPHFDKPSTIDGDFNSHNPLWGCEEIHKQR